MVITGEDGDYKVHSYEAFGKVKFDIAGDLEVMEIDYKQDRDYNYKANGK